MDKLFAPLMDSLRDAARGGVTLGRKVICLGRTKVEVIVKLIIDRSN